MKSKQSIGFLSPTLFVTAIMFIFTILMITPASAMNKGELVDAIAKGANLSKADAKRALEGAIAESTQLPKMSTDRHNYIAAHPHGWVEIEIVAMDLKGYSSCIVDVSLDGERFAMEDLVPNGNKGFLFSAPVGKANLEVTASGGCMVSNIGSSGQDGVRLDRANDGGGLQDGVEDANKAGINIIVTENVINLYEFTLNPSRVEASRTGGTGSVHIKELTGFYGMNINEDGLPRNAVQACAIFGDPDFPPYYCTDSFFDIAYSLGIDGGDSFFDVFTELSIDGSDKFIRTLRRKFRGDFAVDSFFDVFTEVGIKKHDSFFDVFTKLGVSSVDSFFDVMYNTHKHRHYGHVTVLK